MELFPNKNCMENETVSWHYSDTAVSKQCHQKSTILIHIAKLTLIHISVINSANSHDTIITQSIQFRYDFQTKFENQTFSLHLYIILLLSINLLISKTHKSHTMPNDHSSDRIALDTLGRYLTVIPKALPIIAPNPIASFS